MLQDYWGEIVVSVICKVGNKGRKKGNRERRKKKRKRRREKERGMETQLYLIGPKRLICPPFDLGICSRKIDRYMIDR